jgi:endonuclease YncB( thermonuclease family)
MKGDNADKARASRDHLAAIIYEKYVTLRNVRKEKYGRLLADVFLEDTDISIMMLEADHAMKYGETF